MPVATYSEPPCRKVMAPRIGDVLQVPPAYWRSPENVKENIEWLMQREQIPLDDLPRRLSIPLLEGNGLRGLVACYNGSTFKIAEAAYSGKFHIWQFRHNGNRIWTKGDGTPNYELARQATKWLVEEKLKLDPFYSGTVQQATFNQHGLGGMLSLVYQGSPKKAVDDAYPEQFKARGKKLPNRFWQSEKGLEAAIHAVHRIVDKERIPILEIPARLTFDVFRRYKLEVLVRTVPSGSHIDLIMAAYYPRFKPSDFPRYRNERLHSKKPTELEMMLAKLRIRADGSVIELDSEEGKGITITVARELMRLEGISSEEAPTKLTKSMFIKYHLLQVFNRLGRNTNSVVTSLFPEKELKPWQIKPTPSGYWNGPDGLEHANEATKWLVEDVLRIPLNEIPEKLHQRDFIKHGLRGMINIDFNGSVYAAVNHTYPGKFNEWEIRHTNMWQGEKGKELGKKAVRWLVGQLGIPVEDVPAKLSVRHFREYGLGGCLQKCFNRSLSEAIAETFSVSKEHDTLGRPLKKKQVAI